MSIAAGLRESSAALCHAARPGGTASPAGGCPEDPTLNSFTEWLTESAAGGRQRSIIKRHSPPKLVELEKQHRGVAVLDGHILVHSLPRTELQAGWREHAMGKAAVVHMRQRRECLRDDALQNETRSLCPDKSKKQVVETIRSGAAW